MAMHSLFPLISSFLHLRPQPTLCLQLVFRLHIRRTLASPPIPTLTRPIHLPSLRAPSVLLHPPPPVPSPPRRLVPTTHVRNLAIIAHVDHGKTTLVDCLLRQSQAAKMNIAGEARVMDSNALEKERGITILSKTTSILWQGPRPPPPLYQLNIVDTPGHADFGGEVERIMSMVDGVCLVVDATDGPMTQTKFVLSKALQARASVPWWSSTRWTAPPSRVGEVENEVFDLFAAPPCQSDEQMDFPIVYACAREGWATIGPPRPPPPP